MKGSNILRIELNTVHLYQRYWLFMPQKLQDNWCRDYCECVRPARLPVFTKVRAPSVPGQHPRYVPGRDRARHNRLHNGANFGSFRSSQEETWNSQHLWSDTWGMRWRSWLRHIATCRKVACSIPNGVIRIFHWHNPSSRTMVLGLTQFLREIRTRNIFWGGKGSQCVGLTILPPSCVDYTSCCWALGNLLPSG